MTGNLSPNAPAVQHPEVRTATELEALPEMSVVIDGNYDVSQKRGGLWCGYEAAPLTSTKLIKFGRLYLLFTPGAINLEATA